MTHWKTILKELQEEKELLNLLQLEFHKLKRRKTVWLLMLSSIVMPFVALIYFSREVASGISAIQFYKWAVFSYTPWIILPVILGMLSTLIIYTENQNDVLKQLWIIPISKIKFFFSKFIVLFLFSMSFMLISAILSGLLGTAFGYFDFDWESSNFLLSKKFGNRLCNFTGNDAGTCSSFNTKRIYSASMCYIALYIFRISFANG